ncbi:hypothetical protein ACTIVE_5939 [Actinomadura verrucosospora]|uniref:Uncharacterized protein n=1 Tax=Actinomadura verrucosospora TaxID=46165 RepID=A0A7D3W1S4_ACTVE|nr:hypothetical protein ACTIVE_5939 [Actinomadura verrucosospora]
MRGARRCRGVASRLPADRLGSQPVIVRGRGRLFLFFWNCRKAPALDRLPVPLARRRLPVPPGRAVPFPLQSTGWTAVPPPRVHPVSGFLCSEGGRPPSSGTVAAILLPSTLQHSLPTYSTPKPTDRPSFRVIAGARPRQRDRRPGQVSEC